MNTVPRTLYQKLWDEHVVVTDEQTAGAPDTLYIDLHLIHEVTSPQAFSILRARGLRVRRPRQTLATMDHSTPTDARSRLPLAELEGDTGAQLRQLARNCEAFDVPLLPLGHASQGIVHVVGPELGLSQPSMTIVCGDSHTSTHGAFGALAFGIGTSEVAYVLATQCLLQSPARTFEIEIDGTIPIGVDAKDIILAVIARVGVDGGTGHVFEYTGSAVRALSMEQRMTLCNMSIEGGARAGLIAPDDTTLAYLHGRPFAPSGRAWETAVNRWRQLPSDSAAVYDQRLTVDASTLEPRVTFGTDPSMSIGVRSPIPRPEDAQGAAIDRLERALAYMALEPGRPLLGHRLDVVFLGSCTNARISDLRRAATLLRGRHIAEHLRMLVVPGSQQVRRQAEAEGLDEVFRSAGAEWRNAGCSMCLAMNDDRLMPGQYALSTSNRNFEGRQGPGARTFLASPWTAAASAIQGAIADPRELLS